MNTSARKFEPDFMAVRIWCADDFLCVQLRVGREVKTPLEFYPNLKKATAVQRNNIQLIGQGTGAHWPDIDEDLSIEGIVLGRHG